MHHSIVVEMDFINLPTEFLNFRKTILKKFFFGNRLTKIWIECRRNILCMCVCGKGLGRGSLMEAIKEKNCLWSVLMNESTQINITIWLAKDLICINLFDSFRHLKNWLICCLSIPSPPYLWEMKQLKFKLINRGLILSLMKFY